MFAFISAGSPRARSQLGCIGLHLEQTLANYGHAINSSLSVSWATMATFLEDAWGDAYQKAETTMRDVAKIPQLVAALPVPAVPGGQESFGRPPPVLAPQAPTISFSEGSVMGPVPRDTQARAAFKPNKTPAGAYRVDKSQGLAGAPPSSDVHGQVEWLRRNVCLFFLATPPVDGSTTCARGSCVYLRLPCRAVCRGTGAPGDYRPGHHGS